MSYWFKPTKVPFGINIPRRELHGPEQYEMLELKLYEEGPMQGRLSMVKVQIKGAYYPQWISAEDMFLYNPKAMNNWCEQQQVDKWRYEYLSGYKVTKLREKQLAWIKEAKKNIEEVYDKKNWEEADERERLLKLELAQRDIIEKEWKVVGRVNIPLDIKAAIADFKNWGGVWSEDEEEEEDFGMKYVPRPRKKRKYIINNEE